MKFSYKNSVVGGTFDRFHKGHEKLLNTAFSESEKVTIGISTEKLYNHKVLANIVEDYGTREASVKYYLLEKRLEHRSNIITIDDIYGTTLEQENIDAIFVTQENAKAAQLINEKRIEKKYLPLTVITVPYIMGNDGKVISSERIRKGETDRKGFSYQTIFNNGSLTLPDSMRAKLRNPIGSVFQDSDQIKSKLNNIPMVIAVGDIVTYLLADAGMQAALSVIDFKTRRHELKDREKLLLEKIAASAVVSKNEAGKIEKKSATVIQNAINNFLETGKKQTIKIDGEEDLLTLPSILLAPLQSVVIYGLYDEGAVLVEVTEQKKKEIVDLIMNFE